MCLAYAVRTSDGKFSDAYLVLGGDGWTLRDFYLSGRLDEHLGYGGVVKIRSLESIVGLANQGRL